MSDIIRRSKAMLKRFIPVAAFMFAVTMTPLASTLSARDTRAEIPFSFTVGDRVMAPGVYSVNTQGNALLIRGTSNGAFALSVRTDNRSDVQPKLVFEKYGDHYLLREVWMGGTTGFQIPRPNAYRTWTTPLIGSADRIYIPLS